MVDSSDSDLEKYSMQYFDIGLCHECQRHMGTLNIESTVAVPGTLGCLHKSALLELGNILLIGCLKIEGRGFDFLDIYAMSTGSNKGRATRTFSYGFVVNKDPANSRKDLAVRLKVIKRGFINREIAGFEWKGGGLAEKLNSDALLMERLKGLDPESPSLGLASSMSGWGTTLQVFASRYDDFVSVWQPVRDPRSFSTMDDIRIAETIAGHIRTVMNGMGPGSGRT